MSDCAYSITAYLQNMAMNELHQGTTREASVCPNLKRYKYDVKLVEHAVDCVVKHLMSDSNAYNLCWWGNDQNTQTDSHALKQNHPIIDGYGFFRNQLTVHQVGSCGRASPYGSMGYGRHATLEGVPPPQASPRG